jgi:hypothetical protein
MLPFTVSNRRCRPPLPIVPLNRLAEKRPRTVSGKSESMDPFTVEASTAALTSAGRTTVIPPFTELNSSVPVQSARPSVARMVPFTELASA